MNSLLTGCGVGLTSSCRFHHSHARSARWNDEGNENRLFAPHFVLLPHVNSMFVIVFLFLIFDLSFFLFSIAARNHSHFYEGECHRPNHPAL